MQPQPGRFDVGVVELRQYTLHPGTRETLIELFDRAFVESQEACGMSVLGQFRDIDRPDRFVWLRGFPTMADRARALAAFYDGPVWAAHRDAANATMVDFDDVLLLKPVGGGVELDPRQRAARGSWGAAAGLVTATIVPLAAGSEAGFVELFEAGMRPQLTRAGAAVLAAFVSEKAANNFPRLPVRADADVFVWLGAFDDAAAHRSHLDRLAVSADWQAVQRAATLLGAAPPAVLRLEATARSLLRAAAPRRGDKDARWHGRG